MIHFHRYPYTVSQKITDLIPITEQHQMKPIRSTQELKTVETELGEYLGLKLSSKIDTESQFADVASAIDILKMYKNNPLNVLVFPWTISPVSEKMTPSVRNSRFSVIYDPTHSSTKEIGFELRVGYATKMSGESSGKYQTLKVKNTSGPMAVESLANTDMVLEAIKVLSPYDVSEKTIGGSEVHPRREQKLKEMLDGVEIGTRANAVTIHMTALIKGNRPRTWTTVLSFLSGVKNQSYGSIKQSWDIRLEKPSGSPDSPKHLCAKGTLNLPILPIWNIHELHRKTIDFAFENNISMGMTSCNEATIATSGNARVSEQQKAFSVQSLEAQKCQKMIQRGALEARSSPVCKKANYQARILDTIELRNQFTRVPEVVKAWEKSLAILTKAYLWQFTKDVPTKSNGVSANTFTTTLKIQFQTPANAFHLIVKRPQEELVFENVRIPYPLSLFAPLKAGSNNLGLTAGKIMPFGSSKMECNIERNSIRRFNKKVIKEALPQHYITATLTPAIDHRKPDFIGVLVKAENNDNLKVKSYVQKGILVLKWESGQPKAELMSKLNDRHGLRIALPLNQDRALPGLQGTMLKNVGNKVLFSLNDVMDMEFDAETITLRVSTSFKNQLSGLCGSSNLSMKGVEPTSLSSCRYSKPSLEIASSMLHTGASAPLNHSIKQELQKEQEQCQRKF